MKHFGVVSSNVKGECLCSVYNKQIGRWTPALFYNKDDAVHYMETLPITKVTENFACRVVEYTTTNTIK